MVETRLASTKHRRRARRLPQVARQWGDALAHGGAISRLFVKRLSALGLGPVQGKGLAFEVATGGESKRRKFRRNA